MPEKTRDRKSWFPRFKSNWLGTYRSKQMFVCCECGVKDGDTSRYKGAEGKHCVCGKDQWHLAKSVEEAEYNRRMEISKAFGGLRYDEAVQRLKAMGASEQDFQRARALSDGEQQQQSMDMGAASPVHTPVAATAYSRQPEFHRFVEPQPQYPSVKQNEYGNAAAYTPVGVDMLGPFANDQFGGYPISEDDTMGFGEMLQDIMEDDGTQQQQRGYYAGSSNAYQPNTRMNSYPTSPMYAQPQQQPQQQQQQQPMDSNDYYGAYPAYRDMPPFHHAPFQSPYQQHYAQPLTTAFASDL